MIVDLDATLITAHSEKELATPTFKRGFGFHPLCAFLDHGPSGTGQALATGLRKGNEGSNTAADHIAVNPAGAGRDPRDRHVPTGPEGDDPHRRWGWDEGLPGVADQAHGVVLGRVHRPDRMDTLYRLVPETAWQAAIDADGDVRDGAGVVDLTDSLRTRGHLDGWPEHMWVIVRREQPHPGAQLRFADVDGYRLTAFVTHVARGQLADLELGRRRRARCDDRMRIAKDSGLMNPGPFRGSIGTGSGAP